MIIWNKSLHEIVLAWIYLFVVYYQRKQIMGVGHKLQKWYMLIYHITGGHRTRVAAVTLDNMAGDAVAASASLQQILTVSLRYCGPAFVSWLSMLWDTLTRKPELQWFGISSQFQFEVSRSDEGVGHVCFPGDEGVGRPWRGYRCVQMNVGPALYIELPLNLGLCIYFWIQNPI